MPITPSPAVLRACDVLLHLASSPQASFTVSELARELGIPRATCDGVLLALAERGFVDRREPDLRYTLGPAGVTLGDAARASGSLVEAVAPAAESLARATGTCVAVVGRDRGETRVERVFDHGPAFGVRARAGESVPLVPPFGAVFVAWDRDPAIEAWLDAAPSALDPTERARYRSALAAVRARGYSVAVANVRADLVDILDRLLDAPGSEAALRERDAVIREITHSEYLPVRFDATSPVRVNQMSAPVFDRTGRVCLALMVLGPTYDLSGAEVSLLAGRLLEAAADATGRIGGCVPDGGESGEPAEGSEPIVGAARVPGVAR